MKAAFAIIRPTKKDMTMTLSESKKLPLHTEHAVHHANFMEFAGWTVPLMFSNITEEHQAVRRDVGLFDVSHMGKFMIEGERAAEFIEGMFSNRLSKIGPGKAIYGLLLNPQGGIVDDVIVYHLGEERYFMVVNAGTRTKDWDWLKNHRFDGVELSDRSEELNILAVQGPKSPLLLSEIFDLDFRNFPSFSCRELCFGGARLLVGATGYTGERGFEMFVPAEKAAELYRLLFEKGEAFGLMPVGFGARDTLRLEARYHLYGQDMDDSTTPGEAGLEWVCDLSKDFIGKNILLEQKARGVLKKLVGFEVTGGIARHGHEVVMGDQKIGHVTSGTFSPTLKKAIGLAYVPVKYSAPGSEFEILIRDKRAKARVVKGPFYKRGCV